MTGMLSFREYPPQVISMPGRCVLGCYDLTKASGTELIKVSGTGVELVPNHAEVLGGVMRSHYSTSISRYTFNERRIPVFMAYLT